MFGTVVVCFLSLQFQFSPVRCGCTPMQPTTTVYLDEDKFPDTTYMFIMSSPNSDVRFTAALESDPSKNVTDYFERSPIVYSGGYIITYPYNKRIDLDAPNTPWAGTKGDLPIIFNITCTDAITGAKLYETRKLIIKAVDEFPLLFQKSLLFYVREDASVGTKLGNVARCVEDKDATDSHRPTDFYIEKYKDPKVDGYGGFTISQDGIISSTRALDYETGDRLFHLNITAYQSRDSKAYGDVTIRVINVNDNQPAFFYPLCDGCPAAHYETSVKKNFTGELRTIMIANDLDGDPIQYNIHSGAPKTMALFISLDKENATMYILRPAKLAKVPLLNVIIRAKSLTNLPDVKNVADPVSNEAFALVLIYVENYTPKQGSYSRAPERLQNTLSYQGLFALCLLVRACMEAYQQE